MDFDAIAGDRVDSDRYRTAFDAAADAIMIVDLDTALQLDANRAACDLFEYSLEELRAMTGRMLASPGQDDIVRGLSRQLREGGRAHHGAVRARTKSGREFWAEVRMQVSSHPRQYVTIVRDVTERIEREETLSTAARRKDEFLAVLSHELRNPLAPIVTATELLRGRIEDPEAQRYCAIIDRQMHHMRRLVDDLLDIARITRDKIELRREPITAASVVAQAVEACRPTIDQRQQRLTVTITDEPLDLHADPARMVQVLTNLLDNGSKYGPPGGQLRLAAAREKGWVRFTVSDDGTGVPSDMLDRIFEPFVQLGDGSSHGLGIGLALVKRLVELHGGDVQARSDGPGLGTEVTVRVPRVERHLPIERQPAAQNVARIGAPRRVLVVDDNVDAAEMLAVALRKRGEQVFVTHDGPGALVSVAANRFDVAFIDIGLPGMDGCEVARQVRRSHPPGSVRLVALSGFGQRADVDRALVAGFDDYLVKPVDLARVAAALD